MSGQGFYKHHGLVASFNKHGFVFRLNHSTAFNGYAWIENNTPPLYYSELNLNDRVTGFEIVKAVDGNQSQFLYVANVRLNGSMSKYGSNKEHDRFISGNQFCFVWRYDTEQSKWVAGNTVFSWLHSSAGDGPVGKIYNGEVGNYYPESYYSNASYIGVSKYQVGIDRTYNSALNLITYCGVYNDSKYNDSIQGVDSPTYEDGGAVPYGRRQNLISSIFRNGKEVIKSEYLTRTQKTYEGMSDLTLRITEIDGLEHVTSTVILGCHAINSNRVLIVMGVVYDLMNDQIEHRVYLFDVNGFGEGSVVKLGNDNDNSYIIAQPEFLINYGQKEGDNRDVFSYPWRFSQDGEKLSCLIVKNEFVNYTLPAFVSNIINYPSSSAKFMKKGVSLNTYTVSYNESLDSYSVSLQSSVSYSPYLEITMNSSVSGGVPNNPPPGGSYDRSYTNSISIDVIDCTQWPVAISYKDNELKTCWLSVSKTPMHAEGYGSYHYEDDNYDKDYDIFSSYDQISYTGVIFDETRGLSGTLIMSNNSTIILKGVSVESILDKQYDRWAYSGNYTWHTELTVSAATDKTVFYIDAANDIVIYGRRCTQLSATTNETTEYAIVDPPKPMIQNNEIVYYNREYIQNYAITYVGGTELYYYYQGVTTPLVNNNASNYFSPPETRGFQEPIKTPFIKLYPTIRTGVRHTLSPYFGIFNDGAANLGLFYGNDAFKKDNFFGWSEKANYNIGVVVDARKEENNVAYWVDLRQINCEMLTQALDPANVDHYEYFNRFPETLFDRVNLVSFVVENPDWQTNINTFLSSLNSKYSYLTLYPIGLF